MSIQKAKDFLQKVQTDESFRDRVIVSASEIEFGKILEHYEMAFSSSEMEEAFNMLHVKCQYEEEAENLKQAYLYYQLLVSSFVD